MVPLAEEWAFVERYLEIERIRFGDRLQVQVELSDAARERAGAVVRAADPGGERGAPRRGAARRTHGYHRARAASRGDA